MAKSSKKKMSNESYQAKEAELKILKTVRRKEYQEKLKEAREQGDLSENAEYDAALEEQQEVESRIWELEDALQSAEVYDEKSKDFDKDAVHIGSTVRVYDITYNEEMNLHIVETDEVRSLEWKISDESPAGAALMEKKVGSTVTFEAPAGTMKYKILEIA